MIEKDIEAKMRSDLEATGINADKYFRLLEVVDGIIDTPRSYTGSYLLRSGKSLKFVFSGSVRLTPDSSMGYDLLARASFDPVGIGWREVEIWEGNLSRAKSGGPNMPQISISARFSPGRKLDQAGIVISQNTGEDLGVYLEVTIRAMPRRKP